MDLTKQILILKSNKGSSIYTDEWIDMVLSVIEYPDPKGNYRDNIKTLKDKIHKIRSSGLNLIDIERPLRAKWYGYQILLDSKK